MLSGEVNENGKKKTTTTTIGLIIKKATLHVQHTFLLYISLPLFCTTLDCSVKFPETSQFLRMETSLKPLKTKLKTLLFKEAYDL